MIAELFNDKSIKSKAKTETLSDLLLENKITIADLILFSQTAKDATKATCIEALEFASKKNPPIVDTNGFQFVTGTLKARAPRIKWESAKVVGNVAHLFKTKLDEAITNLLTNSEHKSTVVRWSAAYALSEIIKLKTAHNKELLQAIEVICIVEPKSSIKKIYLAALKASINSLEINNPNSKL